MSFYENSDNVDNYIKMCKDYDGSNIYKVLQNQLPKGKSVLELGSGPGFDIPFLKENYKVTGSDFSEEFLNRCREKFPDTPFLKTDAKNININEKFDCIYSNKVLHHLTEQQLSSSLKAQAASLSEDGLIAHSFWMGDENQVMEGLLFTYYKNEELLSLISENYTVLTTLSYQEFDKDDSLFVIAQLKSK
ncbi:class I SAM-dependent methyltransferase [bacterium]|nr:class I SAM-dependent methyltransferase [bacterium]